MLDLYYSNSKTDVNISAFETSGDFPYTIKMTIEGATIKENTFKTQKEALRDFMWLVLNNILIEEQI